MKKPKLREWAVPYVRTCRGTATVEARTAEEAEAIVDGGGFDADRGEEQTDWSVCGSAREES